MKIMTILGTRPEIIRLSRILPLLDNLCSHVLVHTGQNFDRKLNEIFFEEFDLRQPDYVFESRSETPFGQIGTILSECERVMMAEKPDRLLILGDTNSALAAIVAKRMGIPVFHMEAGNRCYDDRVPEEVNRRIIDHSSDILLPYTERSRQNLLTEGIPGRRIFVTGNPIWEVIKHHECAINAANILNQLHLRPQSFFLVTVHRAENVDVPGRLDNIVKALLAIQQQYKLPVIVSTHPRTKARMAQYGLEEEQKGISFLPPFGFFDFISLQKHAFCVLSDSGTVQEECTIFGVPNVTIRDVTERPETLECGSNMLSGAEVDCIVNCVSIVLKLHGTSSVPNGYLAENVSRTLVKILLGTLAA